MIVAANDVRNPHVMIVDDDREHVGGRAIGAQQDEIVDLAVLNGHLALNEIGNRHGAVARRFQANDERRAGGRFGWIAIAPATVVTDRLASRALLFPQRRQLFGRRIAFIGVAAFQQLAGDLRMARRAGELMNDLAIPIEAKPRHAIEDRIDRRLGGTGAIGIFDPQQELAAVMARKQPVEQRGARAADMQKTRR